MKDWYPDNFKATSDKVLKTFPEDTKNPKRGRTDQATIRVRAICKSLHTSEPDAYLAYLRQVELHHSCYFVHFATARCKRQDPQGRSVSEFLRRQRRAVRTAYFEAIDSSTAYDSYVKLFKNGW